MKAALKFILSREKTCIWTLLFTIAFLSSSYLYFVNKTIFHAVTGEQIESEIGELTSSIADLESTAISIRNAIDLNTAHALGYHEAKISRYIERKGVSLGDSPRTIR